MRKRVRGVTSIEKPTIDEARAVPGFAQWLAENKSRGKNPRRGVSWEQVGPFLWLWWQRGGKANASETRAIQAENQLLRERLRAIQELLALGEGRSPRAPAREDAADG